MEHRRFHRVKFTAQGDLRHQGLTYRVRLENISLNGALVSSEECILIPEGDHCSLSIRLEAQDAQLEVQVQVVHSFFSMVGVRFHAVGKDTQFQLFQLLQEVTAEPTTLKEEWQGLLAHKG
jgi:c-di-GMP-binding flagellar brake protein YcgR